jgi:hypothetical protein
VANFFVGIAETLAGLMALYSEFPMLGPEAKQRMTQGWNPQAVSHEFAFSVFPDSTVLLDATQQIQRLGQFLNMTAKSGFVNVEPIIAKMSMLSGVDPADVMVKPNPPEDPPPNVSYRFSGAQDLTNPMAVAIMLKAGTITSDPKLMEEAKKLILESQMQLPGAAPMGQPQGLTPPAPEQPPTVPEDPHPDWGMADRLDKRRSEDM